MLDFVGPRQCPDYRKSEPSEHALWEQHPQKLCSTKQAEHDSEDYERLISIQKHFVNRSHGYPSERMEDFAKEVQ